MYKIISINGKTGSKNMITSSKIVRGSWPSNCSLKYTVKDNAVNAPAIKNDEVIIKVVLLNFFSSNVPMKAPINLIKPVKIAPT